MTYEEAINAGRKNVLVIDKNNIQAKHKPHCCDMKLK